MYRTILLPTDGSDAANSAVGQAYEVADRFGATVHVLYVIDVEQNYSFEASEEELAQRFREEGETVTEEAARRAPEGVDVVTAIEEGSPHQCILEYADEHGADLIAMGTHDRRGLDRFLIGSVTERVLRGADASMLVTRTAAEAGVETAERAIEIARDVLVQEGHEDATVLEEPYEQGGYWIVRTEADNEQYNVHIERSSGDARVARIERR
ncbi:universal stress protein [Natronosalvus caseinilyticus]|uniref:universal stress protein n=1 Tax=Natronosalvus caseinilyticus TaxID=2953747 RepID=UPI0028A85A67|nr:universal stress protein [Natronosalvus caseinilyticus]